MAPVILAAQNIKGCEQKFVLQVNTGVIKLVGTDKNNIISNVQLLLENPEAYNKMASGKNPYGDGTATVKILNFLISHFNEDI
ncbi:MAG: UDP-N-acetylglucosamine 2-epimerase [Bacteroidota bacterium]|nr:UDP-N-acetylglucosamine 2-epimerase [Bacteroidota bacterium]